ncbi:MAG: hypothetical protein ABFD49_11585 [Armatimonadota bacterium]|nr:hypothetical protein [bacterium]
MNEMDIETRAFLQEFQGQPDDVKRIFIYVICQTMLHTGMLQLLGAFTDGAKGITLIYRNPDTEEVFEIAKPEFSEDEEREMDLRIQELLQENARAV